MAEVRFHKQLGQQLRFIENSCSAYDRGQTGEAIRIATSLRILLHYTPASTSLLTHLGAKDVALLSTCAVRTSIPHSTAFDGLSGFSGVGIRPKLGQSSTLIELPALEWWEQFVIGLGHGRNLSRRIIALTAANKDGGAHVDEKLPDEYEQPDATDQSPGNQLDCELGPDLRPGGRNGNGEERRRRRRVQLNRVALAVLISQPVRAIGIALRELGV